MVAQAITRELRHSDRYPCPICGGYDRLPRERGIRCGGWTDGDFVYCTREQYAGHAPYSPRAGTYRHRMHGQCLCGMMHAPSLTPTRPARAGPPRSPTPLRPAARPKPAAPLGKPSAVYDYRDAAGHLVMQVLRFVPKTFRQRRPDGRGGWINNLEGVTLVPYHADELAALPRGATVYVCEGEKDADRLRAAGRAATCNPMGAGKWRPEMNGPLAGMQVCILPHHDDVGRAHAQQVATALTGSAASVKVLSLPGLTEHGDISDWLDGAGTLAELEAWTGVWPEWSPPSVAVPRSDGDIKEEASGRKCCRRGDCCRWRAQVVAAAKHPGSRGLLATAIAIDDHLRRREAAGLATDLPFRASSEYRAKEAGCAPATYTAALKRLDEKGALHWQTKSVRPQDINPITGGHYGKFMTFTYVSVPGGADGFLSRLVSLPADEASRGGLRVRNLGACAGCGSTHLAGMCLDCGEVQEAHRPATEPGAGAECGEGRTVAVLAATAPFGVARPVDCDFCQETIFDAHIPVAVSFTSSERAEEDDGDGSDPPFRPPDGMAADREGGGEQ